MRIRIAVFFVIISFFVAFVGASPASKTTLVKANEAFARSAKIKAEKAKIKLTSEPMSKLSGRPVSDGSPTPEAPRVQFWMGDGDEKNNVQIYLDVVASFVPVNPLRVFVNGYRTNTDGVFQTTVSASPESPYKLEGQGVAEIHTLKIVLPGKTGLYGIETQVDWHEQFYHSASLMFPLDPRAGIYDLCINEDGSVNIVLVFNMFDKKFPSNPKISVNYKPLVSQVPMVVFEEGFLTFVSMTISSDDYEPISQDGNSSLFILEGDSDVVIAWEGFLPPSYVLPGCGWCYDPETGQPVPCG